MTSSLALQNLYNTTTSSEIKEKALELIELEKDLKYKKKYAADRAGVTDRIGLVVAHPVIPDARYVLSTVSEEGVIEVASHSLPGASERDAPFTILLGSCYCLGTDGKESNSGGSMRKDHTPERHQGEDDPIRLRILGGDQLYMDMTQESGVPRTFHGAPNAFAYYVRQWKDPRFREFMTSAPNLALADDHEFWNDYPHSSVVVQFWNVQSDACGAASTPTGALKVITKITSRSSNLNVNLIRLFMMSS